MNIGRLIASLRREEAVVGVLHGFVHAPADVADGVGDSGKAGAQGRERGWVGEFGGHAGGAEVGRVQAGVEGRIDVPVSVGEDHALFHVEEQQVDDGERLAAELLEIVHGPARRAHVQVGGSEGGADHGAIGFRELVDRGGLEAGGQEEFVLGVECVQVAQEEDEGVFVQVLEVGFDVRPGLGWLGGHGW